MVGKMIASSRFWDPAGQADGIRVGRGGDGGRGIAGDPERYPHRGRPLGVGPILWGQPGAFEMSAVPDLEYTALQVLTAAEQKVREAATADVRHRAPIGRWSASGRLASRFPASR